jgi:hypothetical protein
MLTMDTQSTSATSAAPGTAVIVAAPTAVADPITRETVRADGETMLRDLLAQTLDGVDEIADAVAHALGLRDR